MSSFLRALKRVAESRFEISSQRGEARKCFRLRLSYCRDISGAEDVSGAGHGAGRNTSRSVFTAESGTWLSISSSKLAERQYF